MEGRVDGDLEVAALGAVIHIGFGETHYDLLVGWLAYDSIFRLREPQKRKFAYCQNYSACF